MIRPISPNQSLGIKNRVFWIRCQLVFSGVANQALSFRGKGDVGWRDAVALVVGDYFDAAVFKNADAVRKLISLTGL